MFDSLIRKILSSKVYDVALETSVDQAHFLSQKLNKTILFKREDQQPVHSFKCRGAYNKIINLPEFERQKGIIAASAGNHAQGVALAAQRLNVSAVIVMPTTTPDIKVRSVRSRGVEVLLFGDSFDDAYEESLRLSSERQLTFIHPFDDIDVIAGQGTVALELMRQVTQPIDAVFIPVGGGGLAAGMAAYIKYLRPEIKVIGVEPEDAASLSAALKANERVLLESVGLFADGVAVKQIGEENFRILRKTCDDVITVTTDEICAAVKDVFNDVRSVSEPAGAVAVAGLKKYATTSDTQGALVAVLTGSNVNFDRVGHIVERAELGEKQEVILAAKIPERIGAFKNFCETLGNRNITEFNYRYSDHDEARVFAGIKVDHSPDARLALFADLENQGVPVVDLTDNEFAKMHLRHMVGGPRVVKNEQAFRFEFPERPGALLKFLETIGSRWRLTAFHYRNHGAAYGRVFVSFEAGEDEVVTLTDYFNDIGYAYYEENANPAVSLFLAKV